MTAMPPEPDRNSPPSPYQQGYSQQGRALPTQPLPTQQPAFPQPGFPQPAFPQSFPPSAYQPPAFPPPSVLPPPPEPSPEDLAGPRRAKIGPRRLIGGVIWAAITLICAVGGVAECAIGVYAGGVLCLIIAAGTGWFDYRIWTVGRRPIEN
jgi:hypothetical protein